MWRVICCFLPALPSNGWHSCWKSTEQRTFPRVSSELTLPWIASNLPDYKCFNNYGWCFDNAFLLKELLGYIFIHLGPIINFLGRFIWQLIGHWAMFHSSFFIFLGPIFLQCPLSFPYSGAEVLKFIWSTSFFSEKNYAASWISTFFNQTVANSTKDAITSWVIPAFLEGRGSAHFEKHCSRKY